MGEKSHAIKLFANCIPVKGYNRSLICDLQRNLAHPIPNDLFTILTSYDGYTIEVIKKAYQNEYDEILDEYFDFLIENEFIFFTENPEHFPPLELTWFEPFKISHAIIDYSKESDYDIIKVIKDINNLRCRYLQIRLFNIHDFDKVITITKNVNSYYHSILSLSILIKYDESLSYSDYKNYIIKNTRINSLVVYGAPKEMTFQNIRGETGTLLFSSKILSNSSCCGEIESNFFTINIKSFTESLNFNSCLNGKISIDSMGNIKNCPSLTDSFGRVNVNSISTIVRKKSFTKLWEINKDKIKICKDCEFRYICSDCRAFLRNPKDIKSKPLKCGYNPYTNEWSDWFNEKENLEAISFYNLSGFAEKKGLAENLKKSRRE